MGNTATPNRPIVAKAPSSDEKQNVPFAKAQNSPYGGGDVYTPAAAAEPSSYVQEAQADQSGGQEIDFGDRVVIAYNFWKDNVDQIERSKQQEMGLLLFSNLFQRQPLCRQLFQNSDINKQSLRLLDMFGWLLRSLVKKKNKMRTRTLKSLGDRHAKFGIKIEFFRPMLDSLSDSLQDYFGSNYNSTTRLALTSLFQHACNEMMKQSGQKAPFPQNEQTTTGTGDSAVKVNSYRWLRSLDHCLADPVGLNELALFLKKSYSDEMTEFHKAYRIYRCCLTPSVRKEIAIEICNLFLTSSSQLELNDSSDNRKKVYGIIGKCDELQLDYPIDLFDETHVWVKFQISQSAWMKFKVLIQSTM